jgi:hypothetical protein
MHTNSDDRIFGVTIVGIVIPVLHYTVAIKTGLGPGNMFDM